MVRMKSSKKRRENTEGEECMKKEQKYTRKHNILKKSSMV
jgi:hypothetical protein